MNTSNNNIQDFIRAKLEILKNWLFRYSRIIMPIVLVLCVAVTVAIAVSASRRKDTGEETVETTEGIDIANVDVTVPEVPMEKDAIPEINELVHTYYQAMVEGDTDTMGKLMYKLDDTEILRAKETSKYLESYPTLEVYTKAGPKEDTYMVYVYTEVKFYDYDKPIPGLTTYYVCRNEDGDYYFNVDGEEDDDILNYIRELNLQDDYVDLNNKVAAAYNDMVAEDEELRNFIIDLNEKIDKNVGETLAREEAGETAAQTDETGEDEESGQPEETEPEEPAVVVTKVKATDVVNIRSSDSETADKLGKAAVGEEFSLLEERANGWSMIDYNGRNAFIKSEYLEASETKEADAGDTDTGEAEDRDTAKEETEQKDNSDTASTGGQTVTVKENVRIRASASEDGQKLGTAYVGEKLEIIMKQADGWTKIKYNGKTAYVKSDYVE